MHQSMEPGDSSEMDEARDREVQKGAGSPSPSSSRNLQCAMPSQKLLAPIQDSYGKRPHDLEPRLRRNGVLSNPKRPDRSVEPLSNFGRERKPWHGSGPMRHRRSLLNPFMIVIDRQSRQLPMPRPSSMIRPFGRRDRMTALRKTLSMIVWMILLSIVAFGQLPAEEQTSIDAAVNLSELRTLGVGIQVDFPWGGLISTRGWLSPWLGVEGILFVWGDAHGLEGSATARVLYRLADAPVVDFYVSGGVTLPFSPGRIESLLVSAAGGIEFGFRSARNLAWNIEFGISASLDAEVMMVFGTGVHFYF